LGLLPNSDISDRIAVADSVEVASMMGHKVFQEKFFYDFSLSRRIPGDHILRRLNEVVDFSFVRRLTAQFYSHTGQPSVDPVVLFKMMLLGYLYGITSERRLAEECSLNLAFMWYLGYDLDEATPDHSVISKARARYGQETFEEFFEKVLALCVEAGLVKGEQLFADSTLIQANASLKSVVLRADAFQPPRSPRAHVKRVFTENPVIADEHEGLSNHPGMQEAAADRNGTQGFALPVAKEKDTDHQILRSPAARRRGRPSKPESGFNRECVSITDPDASIVSRPNLPLAPRYKQHFTVDGGRVITAVKVTPAAVEDYIPVSELLDRQPVIPHQFCADSHYGIPEVYRDLKDRGIIPVIPRRSAHVRKPRPGHVSIDAFKYDAQNDVYVCPQGKQLRRLVFEERHRRYHYRPRQRDCRDCPIRDGCANKKSVRTVTRSPDQEALEWGIAHWQIPEAKKVLRRRSVVAEGTVAEAKGLHGLRRAVCRGLEKVSIQALLTASVQNLKRLVKSRVSALRSKAESAQRPMQHPLGRYHFLLAS